MALGPAVWAELAAEVSELEVEVVLVVPALGRAGAAESVEAVRLVSGVRPLQS